MTFLCKNVRPLFYALILLLVSTSAASALTIKGVDFADDVTVSGKKLYLNGAGIKKTFFSSVYAGALYLPHPTGNANKAIKNDLCKQIIIHFITKYNQGKIVEGWDEGFFNNSQEKIYTLQERITTFNTFFSRDMVANDRVTITYIPKQGTTVKINDETKGIIPGSDFMEALWAIWLGVNPMDNDMKEGMLGK